MKLNKEQQLAVDSIEGPVMVIAGPGTGKTQILTLRIANIIAKTDTPAKAILAVTFTEAGVIAMRKRLAEIIGSQAYEVNITTFHGFANSVIQKYPESFPRIIGSVSITEADQVRIMEEIIEDTKGLKILRPYGDRLHYLRDALHEIQTLKREGVSVEDFETIIKQADKDFVAIDDLYHEKGAHKGKMKGVYGDLAKQIEKNRELRLIYEAYQQKLTEEKLYDFDDMIMETLNAMRTDADLLLQLQEHYQYVLVDEHQDTNNAQNRILELLMSYHDNPNLFIVGDEKQAIFRFQGASLENFNYFKNKFPGAKLITLTQNYRSSQSILDVAKTNLISQTKHPNAPIQVIEASTSDAELYIISSEIKEKIKKGTAPEEVAILYRTNRDALPMARMLEKLEVSFHIESDLDILADHDIRKLVMIFKAIDTYDPAVLYLDLWGIDPFEVERHEVEIKKKLSSWKSIAHNKGLLELFDAIVQESGLLPQILNRPDSVEALEKLGVFLDQIRRLLEVHPDATLADFMASLARMKEHKLMIRGALSGRNPGKVRLMTVHRSKGLEFEHVYIINCFEGHWGGRRHVEKLKLLNTIYAISSHPLAQTPSALPLQLKGESERVSEDSDERNLFYVALTRAKKTITISYARLALDSREQLPSKLISELKPELLEYVAMGKLEEDFKNHRDILFGPTLAGGPDIENLEYVRELFKKRGFAVTHLNNYLACPWKYFFVNLVRIPKAPEPPQMYGIAVHNALRDLFTVSQTPSALPLQLKGESERVRYLLEQFEKYLATQPMPPSSKEDYRARGIAALKGYYDEYEKTWTNPILPEYAIKGIELTKDILLTGVIDKLEILDAANHVAVTDYKTGKAKSRNEIEGKTRAADASYYRQLVFYNLLLNESGKYKMKQGIIDFIEPNDTGKYKKEIFEIAPVEIKDLEVLIKETADKILNLKFWNDTCGEPDCEWCGLRKMMK